MEEDQAWPLTLWPITDSGFIARDRHRPSKKSQLIQNEVYLNGWSEKVFASGDTKKMRKKATKKTLKFRANCVSF